MMAFLSSQAHSLKKNRCNHAQGPHSLLQSEELSPPRATLWRPLLALAFRGCAAGLRGIVARLMEAQQEALGVTLRALEPDVQSLTEDEQCSVASPRPPAFLFG
jgi:hypothetical protein